LIFKLISKHKQKLNRTCMTHENKPHWFLQELKRAEQHEKNEPHWFSHIIDRQNYCVF